MTDGWIDIGHEHQVRFNCWKPDRELNPKFAHLPDVEKWGLTVRHKTPVGGECLGGVTFDGEVQRQLTPEAARWQVFSLEPETLHIEPSLLCHCGDHGFIRGGRWEPA
jgi:hypothetical protein